jgi:hypothetical protein
MPAPPAWGGAGFSEGAQAVRVSRRRGHLAVSRWRQRPSLARWALNLRPSRVRPMTRVSPSHRVSVVARCAAWSAGSCPRALSRCGEPLPQG